MSLLLHKFKSRQWPRALLISVLGLAGCQSTEVPLRDLEERKLVGRIQRYRHGNIDVDLNLYYANTGNCPEISWDSKATFNGKRLSMSSNGSAPGKGGGACSSFGMTTLRGTFSEMPSGDDATFVLTDGDFSIRMVVENFLTPRTVVIEQTGTLTQGGWNHVLHTEPKSDTHREMEASFYSTAKGPPKSAPDFVIGGPDNRSDFMIYGEKQLSFSVPTTAPIGPGIFKYSASITPATYLVCDNAIECSATLDIVVSHSTTVERPGISDLFIGFVGEHNSQNCHQTSCVDFAFYGGGTTMDVWPSHWSSYPAPVTHLSARWVVEDEQPYILFVPFDFNTMQATDSELRYELRLESADRCGDIPTLYILVPGSENFFSASTRSICTYEAIP